MTSQDRTRSAETMYAAKETKVDITAKEAYVPVQGTPANIEGDRVCSDDYPVPELGDTTVNKGVYLEVSMRDDDDSDLNRGVGKVSKIPVGSPPCQL